MPSQQWASLRWSWCAALLAGCASDLNKQDALSLLNQSLRSERGILPTLEPITYGTRFTPGVSPEEAAQQLANWYADQRNCVETELDGATVYIDFGDVASSCIFEGRRYGGLAAMTVQRTDPDDLAVLHEWTDLVDEHVTLEGEALVRWTADDPVREVHSVHSWQNLDGGALIHVEAEYAYTHPDPDWDHLVDGLRFDGRRAWTRNQNEWTLELSGVERLLYEKAPETGTYQVTSPAGLQAEITFERITEKLVEATVHGERRSYLYQISPAGVPVPAGRGR